MSAKKFHAKSTALEVIEGHDLTGYEVIVTGGNSGIGVETVRAFAKANARVVLAARNLESSKKVADEINKFVGKDNVEIELLDLSSLKSVRDFVQRFVAKKRHLNILVNNAGIMGCPLTYTEEGFELQFGTNHVGHFVLTIGLLPALKEAALKTGKKSRVVVLSSCAHAFSNVDFNDPNFKSRDYDKWISYGQAKTANSLFAVGLNKRFAKDGVIAFAVMPGVIMTGLQKHMNEEEYKGFNLYDDKGNLNPIVKNIPQGASTTVWAAVAPELENKGGSYLDNCQIGTLKNNMAECFKEFEGYVSHAIDEEGADKLWNLTEQLISAK